MQINYDKEQVSNGSIDIEDIGNFAIKCMNDELYTYFIAVRTLRGFSKIIKYGPLIYEDEDSYNIPKTGTSCSIEVIEFNKEVLRKYVDKYINNREMKIKYVEEILLLDLFDNVPDILSYFQEGGPDDED